MSAVELVNPGINIKEIVFPFFNNESEFEFNKDINAQNKSEIDRCINIAINKINQLTETKYPTHDLKNNLEPILNLKIAKPDLLNLNNLDALNIKKNIHNSYDKLENLILATLILEEKIDHAYTIEILEHIIGITTNEVLLSDMLAYSKILFPESDIRISKEKMDLVKRFTLDINEYNGIQNKLKTAANLRIYDNTFKPFLDSIKIKEIVRQANSYGPYLALDISKNLTILTADKIRVTNNRIEIINKPLNNSRSINMPLERSFA